MGESAFYAPKSAMLLKFFLLTSRDLQTELGVSVKTIRTDLERLVQMGLLKTYPLNKRLVGYLRAEDFEDKIREISGN